MEKNQTCANCGATLTADNIRLAVEDARLERDDLRLFCPSYNPESDRCPGYGSGDEALAAYWQAE